MTKPKSITISGPFDARHVGGVSVPGATIPIVGIERSSTGLEPDEPPSHTFVATGNVEVPRRSNTIASSLSRPSLRLKTSISLLRGRSNSHSPDTHRRSGPEPHNTSPQNDMPVQSLRKKPSSSRFWQREHHDALPKEAVAKQKEAEKENIPIAERPKPIEKDYPPLKVKTSMVHIAEASITNPYEYHPPPQSTTAQIQRMPSQMTTTHIQRMPSQKQLPPVRPKRADSGTAIDFDNVPVDERPLGFKEILAVSSFQERMALYKKTRDYWAHAEHGLGEWVGRAGGRRAVASRV